MTNRNKILAFAVVAILVAAGVYFALSREPETNAETPSEELAAKPGEITAAQIKKLGIKIAAARAADAVPLGVRRQVN